MFERFTDDARQAVAAARQEATELHHEFIGCEHLLLALSARDGTPAADALAAVGLRTPDLRERVIRLVGPGDATPDDEAIDEDALASLGIDLGTVRRATEAAFGPGALDRGGRRRGPVRGVPFTKRAKKSLEIAVRTAVSSGDKEISTGHLLLGVIGQDDNTALRVLTAAGVETSALRQELARRMAA